MKYSLQQGASYHALHYGAYNGVKPLTDPRRLILSLAAVFAVGIFALSFASRSSYQPVPLAAFPLETFKNNTSQTANGQSNPAADGQLASGSSNSVNSNSSNYSRAGSVSNLNNSAGSAINSSVGSSTSISNPVPSGGMGGGTPTTTTNPPVVTAPPTEEGNAGLTDCGCVQNALDKVVTSVDQLVY